jgi:hypothetical protein
MNTLNTIMEYVGLSDWKSPSSFYSPWLQRPYSKGVPLLSLNRISILEPARGPIPCLTRSGPLPAPVRSLAKVLRDLMLRSSTRAVP